ncbi:MAG TPA: carboxypeptidase regulatory-like domain-containing protein [Gemmataceae bacterium]|nr:carboxypeptidase regulatory-like domain-containing protein [Gemmataceae bacterium]
MNLQRFYVALALAGVSGLAATPVQAAWDNVFQPACNSCRPATSRYYTPPVASGYYAAPVVAQYSPPPVVANAPPASDCQQCTTRYVQRSYYQPVTTMETKTYYEPVTTYQTSYYYEPVTSYRIAYYADPCGCGSCKQVAVPQTSYQIRAQSSPVQSWVERCMKVPVTTQQLAYYLEPQTTCTQTTVGAPIPLTAPNCPAPTAPYVPAPQQPVAAPQGPIGGSQGTPQYYFAPTNNSAPTPPAQTVAPDRIASADAVYGQVTRRDGSPKSGTQILFVSASTKQVAQTVANDNGRFNVSLPTGSYYVYFASRDNGPAYQGQVQVRPNQRNDFTLVNQ